MKTTKLSLLSLCLMVLFSAFTVSIIDTDGNSDSGGRDRENPTGPRLS